MSLLLEREKLRKQKVSEDIEEFNGSISHQDN